MKIGQYGVGTQVTDGLVNIADAMLVVIGLNMVIFFALLLAIIGAFVALAVIGHATNIITGLAAPARWTRRPALRAMAPCTVTLGLSRPLAQEGTAEHGAPSGPPVPALTRRGRARPHPAHVPGGAP